MELLGKKVAVFKKTLALRQYLQHFAQHAGIHERLARKFIMKKIVHPRTAFLVGIISFGGLWRLLALGMHLPTENFTPIGAMALFGGCYFAKKGKAFLVPLLCLFASDIIIMQLFYPGYSKGLLYEGWPWVYGSFVLMVLLGHCIRRPSTLSVFSTAVFAALLHWVVTDFGIWLGGLDITTGQPFTRDLVGLLKCYTLALPYLKAMLLGNLVFCTLMFGSFELARVQIGLRVRLALQKG